MYHSFLAVWVGVILDFIFGDPYFLWHPIRFIGRLISFLETILRKVFPKRKWGELAAGAVLVLLVSGISTGIPLCLLVILYHWNWYAGLIIESIFCYQLLATKSLKTESMKVYKALFAGDLEEGRRAVSMIVGRDTNQLTDEGIIKATVETVAENTSDGSIAPMFYMMIGGAPLGFFYKAINTMDSMVGYKNERYLYFGRVAARMDDVVNYIPARISAYLMILTTLRGEFRTKNAYQIYRRDRHNHASPNSAHTEAVMAGALGVQLAGDAYYFGKLYHKKTIGDSLRTVVCMDIKRANQLLYRTALLGVLVFSLIKFSVLWWIL